MGKVIIKRWGACAFRCACLCLYAFQDYSENYELISIKISGVVGSGKGN